MYEIVLSDAYFRYGDLSTDVLKGLSLNISKGELVVITGPTGSGKTTLCRIITGLISRLYRGELRGYIKICNEVLTKSSLVKLRKYILYIPQNPEEYLLNITVRDEITSYMGEMVSYSNVDLLIKYLLSTKYYWT